MDDHTTDAGTDPVLAPRARPTLSHEPLAVVGIGCRFPGGANDPDAFWNLLEQGTDAVTEVPPDRWSTAAFYDAEPGRPGKTQARWGGFLQAIDQFDPHFFGISPREAARMDPQQRLLLETAWEALEDGGLPPDRLAGTRTTVFVGISSWDYSVLQVNFRDRGALDTHSNTGGSLSIAANRISYCLGLRGPSAAVDTACSSALVAVHLACKSIWEDGCPLALAAGVNALLLPDWYVGFSRMGMLSPDGRCRAFDARGNGFVRAEGAGVIVLKPLARARADGDRVYAVIRGTAVNQDGRTDGMTVPSEEAQAALLREACRNAGIAPSQIQYIEAHGTGTPVGDPIEARALGRVLSSGRPVGVPCLVGSVKTNIGHLEAGAGIAGLIKTALALHHRRIPGNLHFEQPNPAIDFEGLRLRVPICCEPWPAGDGPALAGVNSFGFGGTNAHVVLQGCEKGPRTFSAAEKVRGPFSQLIPLSARSPEALRASASNLRQFVTGCPDDVSLADVAWNAAVRRSHHDHRLAVIARSKHELAENLAAFAAGRTVAGASSGRAAGPSPRLAFVCPGQGPQWWAMGRQLLAQEPVFREAIERCDAVVRRLGPWSLLDELTADEGRSRMDVTAVSQPAIFALQIALAALWRSWGVRPEVLIGHSVGEVAAAHLAGVLDLDDAVRVIYHRGRCMERAPSRGQMLAAALAPDEARRLIDRYGDRVSLAAINAPASVTLSGETEPLEEIARALQQRDVFCRFLHVRYAFHSAQMDSVRDELQASLRGIRPRPAALPLFSTVTGRRVAGPELDAEYWWHNVRRTVRFADGVDRLFEMGCDAVVELSPHPVLAAAVTECAERRGRTVTVLPSLRRHEDERATMLHSLGRLHTLGQPIEWPAVTPGPRRFVRLPSYAWQRERYWSESEESQRTRLTPPPHPLLGGSLALSCPAWETRLDLRLFPYLADHRVQAAAIVPATAYLEMAFAAARELSDYSATFQIEDVKLASPCFLTPDRPVRLQTVCHADGTVRIQSRAADADAWTAHASATPRARPSDPTPSLFDVEAVRQRCPRLVAHEDCYAAFQKLGLDYGPQFRGIERVWRGDGESLGEVVLPAAADGYLFHPAALDACFQVVILADSDFNDAVGGLYLPVEVEHARLHRRPVGRLWSHARLREKAAQWSVADVAVYDEEGRPVAEVRGLRSRRVAGGAEEADGLLYAYAWHAQPRPAVEVPEAPGQWLLFADRGGVGERLAARLRGVGERCVLVFPGDAFDNCGADSYAIVPGSRDDMLRLLRAVVPAGADLRGIVHLWNLDAPAIMDLETADLEAAQAPGLLSVLHLVQAWDAVGGDRAPRLFLVTRGAQSVGEPVEPVGVAQSPVLGLGRVIGGEYPRLRCKLVDVDFGAEGSLFDELWTADDEDEVALRGSVRYVHRFMPAAGRASAPVAVADMPYRLATRPGTLDGLTPRALRRTKLRPGEVEIEVAAAGLNFSDVMKALGIYPGLPDGPVPLGAECAGRVVALGDDIGGLRIGDEVLAVAPFAFGSHVTTRAELVAPKPARLTLDEAAAFPIAFLTAYYALHHLAHLAAGERVLIHSAAGGVGLAAVQLARRAGAVVFATAGTAEKREFLKSLGVEHVLDSRSLAFADEVRERAGGVDVVLNSLAGEALVRSLATLDDCGRFVEIGKRDIYQNAALGLRPFRKNLAFFAVDLDRLIRDRPALLGGMLRQLTAELADGRLEPLPFRTFPIADAADAFRHMQQARHIGKVVLSMRDRPARIEPGDEPIAFRTEASYLVTGGLGGFGLAVARWMAERGARNLVLVGRRGAESPEAKRAVADLEGLGVRVLVLPADVSKPDDVTAVLAAIDRDLPPLRGVVHAAMVLEDALLLNLDDDRMRRVLAPKVSGAWNLHVQTRSRPLDFFILFSSLSSVFGHAGQGNYAAANAFLDALASYRRAHGLPGLTVNWGYLGEVGYLAQRPQLGERLDRQGVKSFTVREALTLLERTLRRGDVQVSVMRVDWSRWRGLGVTGRVSPRFAHLLGAAIGDGLSGLDGMRTATPGERRRLLEGLLRDKVARVLGTSPDRLDGEKPLLQLGFDSLMAVELRNWISGELRVNLPIVELMRSPTLVRLADLLLEQIPRPDSPAAPPATERNGSESAFPLAHGQRGLWVLHQRDRTGAACNVSFASRFRAALDRDAFRRALQGLIDRHPSLRTTFEERDGELRQRVHDGVPVPLEILDASLWSESALRERIEEEVHRPFDLERGPLVRMVLFARAADDHVFLLAAHHIVGDFWSLVVVTEEVRTLYPAARDSTAPRLAAPTGHYRDFVEWQAAMLAGPDGERLRDHWEARLAGVPPVLDLPTDRPRPARFTHRGAAVPVRINADLTGRLKALAAGDAVTLYTVLLTAFQALLGRYTGQEDLVVGSPFAGRNRPEFEGVVGYFINMLPLRADLSGDPPFRELLRRTSAVVLDALQHQDYPFALLVERLHLKRDPSRTPLVQATFTLEKAHRSAEVGTWRLALPGAEARRSGDGLETEPFAFEQRSCQADLEMVLEEEGGLIEGALRYNADLFDADTVERLVGHLLTLLEGAAADPDRRLSELPWLTDAERRRVLHEWNDTACEFPQGLCLHQLFEQQARRTPDAVAVRSGDRSLRYAELDAWANRIAHRLRSANVGPGTLVALCLERSLEMVAAILGTLKAGAAYVPLDPSAPAERSGVLLADTAAAVLLTHRRLADRMPSSDAAVIVLDGEAENGAEGYRPPVSGVGPGDLAYVLYTSGSTGRPRGVMVEHRAICNAVLWQLRSLPLRPDDRALLNLPYFFDASLCVLFPTLAAGAQLVLAAPGEERDPSLLLERIERDGVTVLSALPSVLALLLDGPMSASGRTLRRVCCGGEPMPPALPARVFDLLNVELVNLYGPTEAAVNATWWTCRRDDTRSAVPIGRPIANVRAYVLDAHGRPVPAGVPGELHLGGAGLARGYLNDAELTAERFISDPFSDLAGARLYRTGDRCRWRADGTLEFLGRLDRQVKVGGCRVEPGEVEAALLSHPSVREAAVTVGPGAQRLVAHVVSTAPELLRRHLEERLPAYMMPSAIVPVLALPRTPSGKLDLGALPPPRNGQLHLPPALTPRSPLEEFLAGLWRDVTAAEQVGIEDDFFDLGGSSLQAAVVVGRVREKLGRPISTVALFDSPTVAGLARHLGGACPEAVRRVFGSESLPDPDRRNGSGRRVPGDLLVPLQPDGSRPPCFMVHPPGGVVACYRALARHLGRGRPFYGIRARGLHGEEEPPARLEDMAAEYVAAIRAVRPEGPYHLGGWSLGGVVAVEMARQLRAQGQAVGLLALLDTTLPPGTEGAEEAGREYGLDLTLDELDQLGPGEQLPYLWEHVRKLGLIEENTPLPLVRQIVEDLRRLFQVHVRLAAGHVVRPYPGRITLFRPSDTPVPVATQPDRGWGRLAETVDVQFVPGHHHSMVQEPHVRVLARRLRACLRQANGGDDGIRERVFV